MIQTYNEKITDLIIDEMLYELVNTMQVLFDCLKISNWRRRRSS